MAHEAAHVVQQQSGTAVQMWSADRGDSFEREADRAASAVVRGESFAVRERVAAPRVQRLGIKDALNYFADAAYNIPGYRMFTVILGVNPINMEHVDRSPANILRAAVEFIPGGHLITEALDKYGVFDKVGAWVQQQIDTLAVTGAAISKALHDFLDSLSWKDIFHLDDVWERAKRIFSEPIDRIKNLLVGLLEGIWKFVREAILKPIAKLAEGTAGWDLLIAVLGKNPITGEEVPRTADNLIGGFMKLIHQEEIWENIKRGNAVARAFAWFQGALSGAIAFVSQIPQLFITALKSLTWTDILDLPAGFLKVASVFGQFLGKFITWAGNTIWDLLQIIFEVVAPGAIPYLKKLGAAIKSIFKNPIGFVKNLVAAGKLGFEMFVSNIGAHLKASFIEWLTGSLPGVYIPKALDLKEILKFVLSVLGLTWENIRGKLVKVVGETAVKAMETGFDIVVTLVKEGPAAAWEKIKEEVGDLKETVMQSIMSFVIETVVKKAVEKVVSLLVPGGAFIQAIISIYDTIMVFVEKLSKIIQVVMAFLDSMMQIAAGAIGAAAGKVESTLAGLLTLAINFLAGFIGLGKVADKVMEIIKKIRAPIDKALDKVIDWIVTMGKKLLSKVFGKKDKPDERTEEQKKADLHRAIGEAEALQRTPHITEDQLRKGLLPIKQKYNMTSLDLVVDNQDQTKEKVHVVGKINPEESGRPSDVEKLKDEIIKEISIPRPSFTTETDRKLGSDKIDLKGKMLDRRHVVSSKDMANHYESVLNGKKKWSEAKALLEEKHGVGKLDGQLSDERIQEAARTRHKTFFNDVRNLFLGPRGENRALRERVDVGKFRKDVADVTETVDETKVEAHIKMIKEEYALDGTLKVTGWDEP
jgi:hypothetical protein